MRRIRTLRSGRAGSGKLRPAARWQSAMRCVRRVSDFGLRENPFGTAEHQDSSRSMFGKALQIYFSIHLKARREISQKEMCQKVKVSDDLLLFTS